MAVSTRKVLSTSWAMLRARPVALSLPPLALMTLLLAGGPATTDVRVRAVTMVVGALVALAFNAGWFSVIGRVIGEQRARMDDFLEGVGRGFLPLLLGSCAFLAPGLVGLTVLSVRVPGLDPTLLRAFFALDPTDPHTQAALLAPRFQPVMQWLSGLMAIALFYAIFAFFLSFWMQAVVLGRQGWFSAWRESARLARGHWWPLGLVGLVQGLVIAMGVGLTAVQALAPVGWLVLTFAQVYFTVAYAKLYAEARGGLPTPEPEATAEARPPRPLP